MAVEILGGLRALDAEIDDETLVVKLWKMEKRHPQQQPWQPSGFGIVRDCRKP